MFPLSGQLGPSFVLVRGFAFRPWSQVPQQQHLRGVLPAGTPGRTFLEAAFGTSCCFWDEWLLFAWAKGRSSAADLQVLRIVLLLSLGENRWGRSTEEMLQQEC